MEAPEYFQINGYCSQFSTHSSSDTDTTTATATAGPEHFIVEELLDFSNDDDGVVGDGGGLFYNTNNGNNNNNNSTESSAVTVIESCNSSSFSGCEPNSSFLEDISGSNLADAHFSSELCVPYDDLAELEWLSHFVEESFSSEDMQKLELISGVKVRSDEPTNSRQPTATRNAAAIFKPDIVSVPAKARSKRSRAVPSNWNNSRLLPLSPTTEPEITATAGPPHPIKKNPPKAATAKKKDSPEVGVSSGEGRKCMHCATDKTPQWRTGPMGPKTLCNACGVRYKSGRLVPEYRPAASPTFVLTKHSNSHRKVLELRRQKELLRAQQQQQQHLLLDHHQDMIFDASNGDDYLIHQHMGPDFRQLI
ncbi:GATA transcription factor 12-like [Benincasa hispida]|uniref:GATA transcription factor 12-like n=1 Tax=Benincasa hispida TaxID=102211 RepID=UPI001900F7E9|nr:GATA transcription factor 12-like [Benincasa hispida]